MTEVRDQDSAPSFTDPIAPLRIALRGRYEIERQIGQGAFATVYLARDLKHERKVAIKVLNADPTSETGEIRFIREIRLVARLQHPNILPLHDSGHVEALLYYVMPFVDGETLRVRMHRERQMAVDAACAIARETADALAYAHKQGTIHRDIKPENILLSGGHAVVADFGIARAIDVGGVKQLTATGVAGPGTPAYMSPEQLLGDRAVDTRSDIYSLGCVLYEMLVGKPPYSGKDGFVKRFTEPPPHISSLRRDTPPWLDTVIAKALSKDPADRYPTATDLVAALYQPSAPLRTPGRHTPIRNALASPPLFEGDPLEAQELGAAFPDSYPSGGRSLASGPRASAGGSVAQRWVNKLRANRIAFGLAGVAIVAVAALVAAASNDGSFPRVFGAAAAIDPNRLVVLSSARSAPGALPDIASQIADSLYDAFIKWDGLPVVAESRVAQAIASGAESPVTEDGAVSLARRLGAGKAVWVQSSGNPRSPRLRIYLYDVESGESVNELGVPAAARGDEFYANVSQQLLGAGKRPPTALGCDGATRSFPAWSACNRGHASLASWNFSIAERAFRDAVAADSGYAPARLWLAQIVAWKTPEKRDEWYDLVRLVGESRSLTPRDRLAATGLTAFHEQRFPSACAAYAEMTKLDSLDFLGWYGLGECRSADSAVIADRRSPSGWAFRSSWHAAADAYLRALRIQPGAHEIFSASKLQGLMPVSSTVGRTGIGVTPARPRFRAYPTLEPGDTIGFVPYPTNEFAAIERTPAAEAALRRNTNLLDSFTASWAERFPRSFRAQEARADALEARAVLGEGPPRASPLLGAIDSAVALAAAGESDTKARDIIRLKARKVRIHFKRGEFASARILADSILRGPVISGTESSLIWVAALTGRPDLTAQHWKGTVKTDQLTGGTVPPAVATPASRYFAYAVTGVCGEQLTAARTEMETALRDYVATDIRDAVRADLADRSASLATPCTNGASVLAVRTSRDPLTLAQQAYARGNVALTRRLLATAASMRRGRRPGDTSADYLFHYAWLRAQLGDTVTAEASLDAALGALPSFGAAAFREVAGAASFPRAIALRAELAAKRGDMRTARRWSDALNQLWASADPPLRRVAGGISSLTSGGSR